MWLVNRRLPYQFAGHLGGSATFFRRRAGAGELGEIAALEQIAQQRLLLRRYLRKLADSFEKFRGGLLERVQPEALGEVAADDMRELRVKNLAVSLRRAQRLLDACQFA